MELSIKLLGAYHDCYITLSYLSVVRYEIFGGNLGNGHSDWRYDEFRLAKSGNLIHEIEWDGYDRRGVWKIECADVYHSWVPRVGKG